MSETGKYEDDKCNRNGCCGKIEVRPSINCSCHINPPCSACTAPRHFCKVCGWEEADDVTINDFVVNIDRKTNNYRCWEPRPLNRNKIDWRNKTHTHFSMIKEGCFPKGTSMEEVRKLVDGTFGGRFTKWDDNRCEFVTYTD